MTSSDKQMTMEERKALILALLSPGTVEHADEVFAHDCDNEVTLYFNLPTGKVKLHAKPGIVSGLSTHLTVWINDSDGHTFSLNFGQQGNVRREWEAFFRAAQKNRTKFAQPPPIDEALENLTHYLDHA